MGASEGTLNHPKATQDLIDLMKEDAKEKLRPLTWHLAEVIREYLRGIGKLPEEEEN